MGILIIGLFIFTKTVIGNIRFSGKDIKFLAIFGLISLFIILRSNTLVIFLFIILIIFSFINYAYQSYFSLPFFHDWVEALISPFRLAKIYLVTIAEKIFLPEESGAKIRSRMEGKGRIVRIIIGGLSISAPFIFLLIVLFTTADPIYSKFVRDLLNYKLNIDFRLWQRCIISIILFVVFLPFIFLRIRKYSPIRLPNFHKYTFSSEMGIAIMLIAFVLGSFLVVQYPYVFVNVPKEINLSVYGVRTYSEYVRRGFIELIVAAVIIYSSILTGLVVWRNSKKNSKGFLKFAQLFLLFELFVFIISLFRRIGLYQTYHGWSLVRIYGGIFLLYLTFMTITLALRHILIRKWVYIEISSVYLLIFALGFFNAEYFIAVSSHPPTVNDRVDYVYLSRLSPDGIEGWKKAYFYAKNILLDKKFKEENIINTDGRREIAYAGIITRNLFTYYHGLIYSYGSTAEIEDYNNTLFEKEGGNVLQKPDGNTIFYFRIPAYNYTLDTVGYNHFYGFKENEKGGNMKPFDFLDRLYIWNYSDSKAFERMNKEIGIQNLLLMQQEYLDLYRRIQKQPEGENRFEFDISLNSPLID